jgi:hypothetical protein
MKTTFIYTLHCPKSGDVKYVGKSNNPKTRLSKHIQLSGNNYDKNKWIIDLKSLNLKPILLIIDEVFMCDWKIKEKFYISKFRELGCDLFNTSIGGKGMDSGNQTSFKPGNGSKRIVCLLGNGVYHETFESSKKAAEYIDKHNISSALNGVTKKAGGYIWIYEDRYKNMSDDELRTFIENSNNNKSKFNGKKTRFKLGVSPWNKGLKNLTRNRKKKNND